VGVFDGFVQIRAKPFENRRPQALSALASRGVHFTPRPSGGVGQASDRQLMVRLLPHGGLRPATAPGRHLPLVIAVDSAQEMLNAENPRSARIGSSGIANRRS
jgi:hypothetical protein